MTVWLDPVARGVMELEASRRRFLETGGPLFGYSAEGGVVVVGAGGPGPKARHRLRSFAPDHGAVDRAITVVHEASQQRYRYLGSWHTHPMGRPSPSSIDVAAAQAMSEEASVILPQPLLIIQASRPLLRTYSDSNLRAYRWRDASVGLALEKIRVLRSDERRHEVLSVDWDGLVV